jgi:hypothetical protein
MTRLAGLLLAVALGLCLPGVAVFDASAACVTTANCPIDRVCVAPDAPDWVADLFHIRPECRARACNSDADCPGTRPLCRLGICQGGRNSVANQPISPGPAPRGVGSACGRIQFGQVKKSVGCPKRLVCVRPGNSERGTCQEPLQ